MFFNISRHAGGNVVADRRHNLAVSILQQDLLKNAVAMVGFKLRAEACSPRSFFAGLLDRGIN